MFDVGLIDATGRALPVVRVDTLGQAEEKVRENPTLEPSAIGVRPWIEDRTGWRNSKGSRFRMIAGARID